MRTEGFRLTDSLGFLRLSDAAFGTGDASGSRAPDTFRFELTLTNTGLEPLQLDLTDRFFTLEDDRGKQADLRYFCCIARGELLAPGQSRRVLLFFRSTEWYGKGLNAHAIYLKVEGLLPDRARGVAIPHPRDRRLTQYRRPRFLGTISASCAR